MTPISTPSATSPSSAGWSSRRGSDAHRENRRRRGPEPTPAGGAVVVAPRITVNPAADPALDRPLAGTAEFSWRFGGAESATPDLEGRPGCDRDRRRPSRKARMIPPDSPGPTASPGSCESGRDLGIISGPRGRAARPEERREKHAMAKHRPETGRNSFVFWGPRSPKRNSRIAARSKRPVVEQLEAREVRAVVGLPWMDPTHLTLSFAPDGTSIDGEQSSLFQTLKPRSPAPPVGRTSSSRPSRPGRRRPTCRSA